MQRRTKRRVTNKGLKKDGTLKKGYKFVKGGKGRTVKVK